MGKCERFIAVSQLIHAVAVNTIAAELKKTQTQN